MTADLLAIAPADLTEEQLRPAFLAHFKKLEEFSQAAQSNREAIAQIMQRLGKASLLAKCGDCGAPIFHDDDYLYYSASSRYVCAPACRQPAPPAAEGDLVCANGNVTLFTHRFARVRK